MGDQRLRDLLEERVADVDWPIDRGGPAWERARGIRRRRHARVAIGSVVVAVVAVSGVAIVSGGGRDQQVPPAGVPSTVATPSTGAVPKAERGGDVRGAATWWLPAPEDEAALPQLSGAPLPAEIDLAEGARPHRPGVPAVAAYMVGSDVDVPPGVGRVVVVGTDRASYSLDVGRLDPVADEDGNAYQPLGQESLAPDGRHVFFVQESSLEVYGLLTGQWTSIETPRWLAEGARWLDGERLWVPAQLGSDAGRTYDVEGTPIGSVMLNPRTAGLATAGQGYGPARATGGSLAQSQYLEGPVDDPRGRQVLGAEAVAVRSGEAVSLLAVPYGEGRSKGCCPVVGWLDRSTVLLATRSDAPRILAWTVGGPHLAKVSEIVGVEYGRQYYDASYADLSRG